MPQIFGEFLEDLDEFLIVLEEVQDRENDRSIDISAVLLVLAQNYGKDLVGRMGDIAKKSLAEKQSGRHFLIFHPPFCQALPSLNVDPAGLADAMEPVLIVESSDWLSGGIYQSIETLARRSIETSELLVDAFVARPYSPVASLASSALLGLAHFDLPEAHRRALALVHAEAIILQRTGLGTLSRFRYSETDGHLLAVTLAKFDEMRMQPNPETDDVLARSYGILSTQNEKASEAFVEMAARVDSRVQTQAAHILFMRAKSDYHNLWYRKALMHLANIPSGQSQNLRYLDHCLVQYASDDPEFVCKFLEAFVNGRSYGQEAVKEKLCDLLSQTLSTLRRE